MRPRHYLDILTGAWAVWQLLPWFENIGKRQGKSPKIYVRDSGILHALLGLEASRDLLGHPKVGASWKGFEIEQVLELLRARDAYFWGTDQGAELDLLVTVRGKRLGFEMKLADAPTLSKAMQIVLEDLRLSHLFVVHPGSRSYALGEKTEALSILDLPRRLSTHRGASGIQGQRMRGR